MQGESRSAAGQEKGAGRAGGGSTGLAEDSKEEHWLERYRPEKHSLKCYLTLLSHKTDKAGSENESNVDSIEYRRLDLYY